MPRRRLPSVDYADSALVFFVTVRAHPGCAPFTDPRIAREVVASLQWLREHREARIYAYCLMPDHLHLLLQLGSTESSLSALIGSMKSFTTRRYWELGNRGMLWQERVHERTLRRSEHARTFVEYILQNPARKGLVSDAAAYQWSGMPDVM